MSLGIVVRDMQSGWLKVVAFSGIMIWAGPLLAIDFVPHSYGHEFWLDVCGDTSFAGIGLIFGAILVDWLISYRRARHERISHTA